LTVNNVGSVDIIRRLLEGRPPVCPDWASDRRRARSRRTPHTSNDILCRGPPAL
jgi:hypothetical protein